MSEQQETNELFFKEYEDQQLKNLKLNEQLENIKH